MLQQLLIETLASAAVSSALVGVLVYLFQNVLVERLKAAVKAEYDTKLESHKAQLAAANNKDLEVLKSQLKGAADTQLETMKVQLKATADAELERLKSRLQSESQKTNLVFTKLNDRRFEAIAKIYSTLLELHRNIAIYIEPFQMAGGPSLDEKAHVVQESHAKFMATLFEHRIFLPRSVAVLVDKLEAESRGITNVFGYMVHVNPNHDPKVWQSQIERLEGPVAELMRALQEDMRAAIGDPVATA
jgi:hypothetical protein